MSPQVSTETEKEKKYRIIIFILIGIIASMLVSIAFFFFTNRNANFDLANSKKKNETLTQKATKYEREAKAIGKQLVAFDIVANKTKKALNEALKHALFISDSSELNLEFEDLCKKLKSDKAEFEKTIGKLDNISAKDFENQLGDYEEKIINISKKFDIFNKKIIVLFKEKSEKDAKIKMDFIYLNAAFEKLQDENTKLKNDLSNALSSINKNKDKTDYKDRYDEKVSEIEKITKQHKEKVDSFNELIAKIKNSVIITIFQPIKILSSNKIESRSNPNSFKVAIIFNRDLNHIEQQQAREMIKVWRVRGRVREKLELISCYENRNSDKILKTGVNTYEFEKTLSSPNVFYPSHNYDVEIENLRLKISQVP